MKQWRLATETSEAETWAHLFCEGFGVAYIFYPFALKALGSLSFDSFAF
jgi:hypothetical protein